MRKSGRYGGKTNWAEDWDEVRNKRVYDWEPQTIVAKKKYDAVERHRRSTCNNAELKEFCAAIQVAPPKSPSGCCHGYYKIWNEKIYDISDDNQLMRLILDIHESVYPVTITRTFTIQEYADYLRERKIKNETRTNMGIG